MADAGRIQTEAMDGVGLLTFCGRDQKNALVGEMWDQFAQALDRFEQDDDVRVIVLTGAGHEAFATDAREDDPAYRPEAQQHEEGGDEGPAREACARLARSPKPVVARIRGECIGAGLALALAADLRIAAADSAFALSAERAAALGLEPLLVRTVGPAAARYLLLTGDRVEAAEALRLGLVSRVVPDAELSDSVADLARLLADRDAGVLRRAKAAVAEAAGIEPPTEDGR